MDDISSRVERIRKEIFEIDKIGDKAWKETLNKRKLAELEFHDRDRDRKAVESIDQDTFEKFYGNKKYYAATDASREYTKNWIETHAKGKVFLDYACGNGVNAIVAAKSGAALSIGMDISPVSVNNARADAESDSVSDNTLFFQADCENTKLPDNSIDTLICSGMLHHLDLSYAFPEMRRILRPGGRILAIEALDYNPAIKLYRMMTPAMRTEWEKAHILGMKDVEFAKKFFDIGSIKYWHILGIAAPHVGSFANVLHGVDKVLTKIPLVRLMAWIFTFELLKPES